MADKALIDSQGILISYKLPVAQAFSELLEVTDSPLPTKKREVDDITTVKSTHKETIAAGVISADDLAYELLMISGSVQQQELEQYFEDGEMIDWKVVLPDDAATTYTFQGTITELSPVRAANKKNRFKLTIAVNGKVTKTTTP
ncbi:phage tail tube protein [Acinetobacter baumannii]|uniref:phage tail tube protein n=1 Tax=Acinetobacter baumannii TaxID=470 RepID=UPI00111FC8F5|nr:phage tail tube protein [Acinetobacter baumannii]MCZ0665521.1 phage tail tube protein [Acinetobacter baumannii]MCZ3284915.1 phage tail tube protein [Acinetobacter baumannii]